jgi:hypothetical protein
MENYPCSARTYRGLDIHERYSGAGPHKHSTRQRTTDFMVEASPRPARRRVHQVEDYTHVSWRLTTSAYHHPHHIQGLLLRQAYHNADDFSSSVMYYRDGVIVARWRGSCDFERQREYRVARLNLADKGGSP